MNDECGMMKRKTKQEMQSEKCKVQNEKDKHQGTRRRARRPIGAIRTP
jgi:hypothetical protein